MDKKRIGILTSGGDCPGLNAAIRAAAKTAITSGYDVIGIIRGWQGLLGEKSNIILLDRINTSNIIDRGGTILSTSRTSPFDIEDGPQQVLNSVKRLGLEGLIVLGGDGTLNCSLEMWQMGLPIIGIPKTIDNDVRGTEYCIGFQTAVQVATDALDRLRSTAASHHRVMILEVMGRNAGWIATYAGMANGADYILIPEIVMDDKKIDKLIQMLEARSKRGISFSIIVVAEGTIMDGSKYSFNIEGKTSKLGGVGRYLAEIISDRTDFNTRFSALGYVQRGGTPVAYDRSLATHFGVKAMALAKEGKYGRLIALKNNKVRDVPLEDVKGGIRPINLRIYKIAEQFFG
jgi:6-phosphofructokinase 1